MKKCECCGQELRDRVCTTCGYDPVASTKNGLEVPKTINGISAAEMQRFLKPAAPVGGAS